ncbi:MAG: 50S ribosomal protein L6 [Candidatus Cloacimonetes bacterium]|nr:50S ribosomal protein L6 [Candidatus Cloacimonadota bacterium]
MSRIGKIPVSVPAGVTVLINGQHVSVKGKLGELTYTMCEGISAVREADSIVVRRTDDTRDQKSKHGLTRALVNNMVTGVSKGFEKELQVIGTGYSAKIVGPWLKLSLGYSHDILLEVPKDLKVVTEDVPRTRGSKAEVQAIITVNGINKEDVGKFSAEIRRCRPPENYKGKGIRYKDEYVRIKPGKAGASA